MKKFQKIMIVDDSMFTRNIHKGIISEVFDAQLIEADSGGAALELYQKEKPDLVFMDLLMPDMDGLEVAQKIIDIDSTAKIVICSTDKQKYRQQDAAAVGTVGFIAKPVDPEVFAEKMKEFFEESSV